MMVQRPDQRRALVRLIAAVLYVVCILAPHAALALSGAPGHCLTGEEQAAHVHTSSTGHSDEAEAAHANVGHEHADDAAHAEQAPSAAPGNDSHAGMCCGLFCVTGLAATTAPLWSAPMCAGQIAAGFDRGLAGHAPDRINRPPIA